MLSLYDIWSVLEGLSLYSLHYLVARYRRRRLRLASADSRVPSDSESIISDASFEDSSYTADPTSSPGTSLFLLLNENNAQRSITTNTEVCVDSVKLTQTSGTCPLLQELQSEQTIGSCHESEKTEHSLEDETQHIIVSEPSLNNSEEQLKSGCVSVDATKRIEEIVSETVEEQNTTSPLSASSPDDQVLSEVVTFVARAVEAEFGFRAFGLDDVSTETSHQSLNAAQHVGYELGLVGSEKHLDGGCMQWNTKDSSNEQDVGASTIVDCSTELLVSASLNGQILCRDETDVEANADVERRAGSLERPSLECATPGTPCVIDSNDVDESKADVIDLTQMSRDAGQEEESRSAEELHAVLPELAAGSLDNQTTCGDGDLILSAPGLSAQVADHHHHENPAGSDENASSSNECGKLLSCESACTGSSSDQESTPLEEDFVREDVFEKIDLRREMASGDSSDNSDDPSTESVLPEEKPIPAGEATSIDATEDAVREGAGSAHWCDAVEQDDAFGAEESGNKRSQADSNDIGSRLEAGVEVFDETIKTMTSRGVHFVSGGMSLENDDSRLVDNLGRVERTTEGVHNENDDSKSMASEDSGVENGEANRIVRHSLASKSESEDYTSDVSSEIMLELAKKVEVEIEEENAQEFCAPEITELCQQELGQEGADPNVASTVEEFGCEDYEDKREWAAEYGYVHYDDWCSGEVVEAPIKEYYGQDDSVYATQGFECTEETSHKIVEAERSYVSYFFPNDVIGHLIGKGGANVKKMSRETGASIIAQPYDSCYTLVNISGTVDSIVSAIQALKSRFSGKYFKSLDFDVPFEQSEDVAAAMFNNAPMVCVKYAFPTQYIALLIGKNGVQINELSKEMGVEIIAEKLNADTHAISIIGTEGDIEKTREKIKKFFHSRTKHNVDLTHPIKQPLIEILATNSSKQRMTLVEGLEMVRVSCVMAPNHVFVHRVRTAEHQRLDNFHKEIQRSYTTQDSDVMPIPTGNDRLCIAKCGDQYYRVVTIDSRFRSTTVMFVDYGGIKDCKNLELFPIRQEFVSYPFQAVECIIDGVNPLNGGNKFDKKALEYMKKAVENKLLFIRLYYVNDEGVPFAHLFKKEGAVIVNIAEKAAVDGIISYYAYEDMSCPEVQEVVHGLEV